MAFRLTAGAGRFFRVHHGQAHGRRGQGLQPGEGGGLIVLAAGAHPDDIEFGMAGTLLLLKQAGAQIHMWNLADGACGTATLEPSAIRDLRWKESLASAGVAGATAHPPIGQDLGLFYEPALLSL